MHCCQGQCMSIKHCWLLYKGLLRVTIVRDSVWAFDTSRTVGDGKTWGVSARAGKGNKAQQGCAVAPSEG